MVNIQIAWAAWGKKVKLELNMCIYLLAEENRIKASYIFPDGERYGEWQMIQFNILHYTLH